MRFWHVLESIFSGPFLTIKLGKFWHFWPKCRRQIGLMPYTYIIYMATYAQELIGCPPHFHAIDTVVWDAFGGPFRAQHVLQILCFELWCPEESSCTHFVATPTFWGRAWLLVRFFGGRLSSYFLFFSCSGRGKGESEAAGRGGVDFLLKIPEGGGSPGGGGAEGPGGCLRQIGDFLGGGLNIFFRGWNVHQVKQGFGDGMLLWVSTCPFLVYSVETNCAQFCLVDLLNLVRFFKFCFVALLKSLVW